MPKALFFNVPAHGHVNPSLPLVAELTRRGHHIVYFLTEGFRARIEAAGAVFRPYSRIHNDYFSGEGLDGSRPMVAAQTLITTAAEILPELLEISREEQPDYILFDGMCPWGQLIPRILGVPGVASLSLLPIGSIRSLLNREMIRTLLPMMLKDFDKAREAGKRAKEISGRYHLPPLGITNIMNGLGNLSISYTSDYFQPDSKSVSPTICFVGRGIMPEMPPDETFPFDKINGRRLIYVSLGSLINENAAFFRDCIEAFSGNDDYVIMSTGRGIAPDSFGALPENIAIYSWVPQFDVLKRASLFITHAGLGSAQDGLYFGLPLLLVPQQDEQTIIAMRVRDLGAGLMLKCGQVSVSSLRDAAHRLLSEPSFQRESQRIGESLRAGGGSARAADEIEAFLVRKQRESPRQSGGIGSTDTGVH